MRVRYGKSIKVKSLLGKQNIFLSAPSSSGGHYNFRNNDSFYKDSQLAENSVAKKWTITSGHKYFCFIELTETISTQSRFLAYRGDGTANISNTSVYCENTGTTYYSISQGNEDNNKTHLNFYTHTQTTVGVYYGGCIDLTVLGLDTLTAQQFYNKYNKYFPLIATGEEITIDDKAGQIAYKNLEEDSIRCKIAGGSSDIYYGYNQLLDGLSDNYRTDNLNYVFDSSTNKVTITVPASGVSNISRISLPMPRTVLGHKYLFFEHIKTGSIIPATKAVSTTYHDSTNTVTVVDNMQSNTDYDVAVFMNGIKNYTDDLFRICYLQGTKYEGGTAEISWSNLIDLTDWFGAGKEPSTVQEFKEKFTKDYYGFCPTPIKLTRYQIEALPSYGYNQLVPTTGTTATINGITFTNNGDGSYTISGTATANTLKGIMSGLQLQANHTYLYLGAYGGTSSTCYLIDAWSGSISDVGNGKIKTYTSNTTFQSAIYVINGTTVNNLVFKPQFIDLTDWYGEGNEPTTVEEFKQTFPNLYYPYSKKRLLNKYMINKLKN